jgi:hypothetical protein
MAAKLTRLTHKIVIQLPLVAESCTICSSRSRRQVRKLWIHPHVHSKLISLNLNRLSPIRVMKAIEADLSFTVSAHVQIYFFNTCYSQGETRLWPRLRHKSHPECACVIGKEPFCFCCVAQNYWFVFVCMCFVLGDDNMKSDVRMSKFGWREFLHNQSSV